MNIEIYDVVVSNVEFIKSYHDKVNNEICPEFNIKLTNDEAVNMAVRFYCDYLKRE